MLEFWKRQRYHAQSLETSTGPVAEDAEDSAANRTAANLHPW